MNLRRSLHSVVVTVAYVLATTSTAIAAPPDAAKPKGENTPLDLGREQATEQVGGGAGGGGIVRTIVGLAVVLAVIYGLYWVLKLIKSGREQRSDGSGLETVGTLALGPGRALHLVRTGREFVLVGSAEHGVTTIRVYDEDEARRLGLFDEDAADPFGGGSGSRSGSARGTRRSGGDSYRGGGDDHPGTLLTAGPKRPLTIGDVLHRIQRWTERR